jgi:hypothetical protein
MILSGSPPLPADLEQESDRRCSCPLGRPKFVEVGASRLVAFAVVRLALLPSVGPHPSQPFGRVPWDRPAARRWSRDIRRRGGGARP